MNTFQQTRRFYPYVRLTAFCLWHEPAPLYKTFPQCFIGGAFMGGAADACIKHKNGEVCV